MVHGSREEEAYLQGTSEQAVVYRYDTDDCLFSSHHHQSSEYLPVGSTDCTVTCTVHTTVQCTICTILDLYCSLENLGCDEDPLLFPPKLFQKNTSPRAKKTRHNDDGISPPPSKEGIIS